MGAGNICLFDIINISSTCRYEDEVRSRGSIFSIILSIDLDCTLPGISQVLEPPNPSIDDSELHKIRRPTDFEV